MNELPTITIHLPSGAEGTITSYDPDTGRARIRLENGTHISAEWIHPPREWVRRALDLQAREDAYQERRAARASEFG